MRPELSVRYEDETWQCVCFKGEPRLGIGIRNELVWNMIDMYKKGNRERKLKTPDYDGKIELGARTYLSHFAGTSFTARGDFEGGKFGLSVLLLDRFDPTLN